MAGIKIISTKNPPKIILIGAGRFGKKHLRVLQKLEKAGALVLTGVVVKTEKSRREIQENSKVPVFTSLNKSMLKQVDAVDIVTPYPTHHALAKKCLRYTNVFVEKPLADSLEHAFDLRNYAAKYKRTLMVGHIYRFNPLVQELKKILSVDLGKPIHISGAFISPESTYRGEDALFECFHCFDILDELINKKPQIVWSKGTSKMSLVDMRYPGLIDAHLKLGWEDAKKERRLEFKTDRKIVISDFSENKITTIKDGRTTNKVYPLEVEPLESELYAFVQTLKGEKLSYPDGNLSTKIIAALERAKISRHETPKNVAIIGGGIFGVTCALLLGKYFSVTLFEKNSQILTEASWANQYRHHWGYHYPRSPETIVEIQKSIKDFEKFYKSMIESVPSYYCIAKKDSVITPEQFRHVCEVNNLPYKIGYPPAGFLNRESVSECIRTPEKIYNYEKLIKLVWLKINKNRKIAVKTNHRVVNVRMDKEGKKILSIQKGNSQTEEKFDYVINATYARYNEFCEWLHFAKKNLKFRLKEIQIVSLPAKQSCAILLADGPFATMTPLQKSGNLYTFGDVPLSVHANVTGIKSAAVEDKRWGIYQTRWPQVKERCLFWYPILKKAKYIKSMFAILPTEISSEKTAARPTSVTSHGFGCWSIFSGKIVHSVATAKQILDEVKPTV